MRLRVVLDANVLYPMTLRDTLLRAAEKGWFMALWSSEILSEATRNLVANGKMNEAQAGWLREQMEKAFEDAVVEGYQPLVPLMPNDEGDRHVAAVAVHADADMIVTHNTKDFRDLPNGIEAHGPDGFLKELLSRHGQDMVALLKEQAADMKKPARSLDDVLSGLARSVPGFVDEVRKQLRRGEEGLAS